MLKSVIDFILKCVMNFMYGVCFWLWILIVFATLWIEIANKYLPEINELLKTL